MAEHDLLDDDLRALDRLAEEKGAAALASSSVSVPDCSSCARPVRNGLAQS